MSMKVLYAILGEDVVDRMDPSEVAALAHELDAEILRDEALTARLTEVVMNASRAADSGNAG
jgi:hypothetical protein